MNIPLYISKKSNEEIIKHVENNENLTNVVLIREIMKNQLIEMDEGLYYIASASEIQNAKQLILPVEKQNKLSNIFSLAKKNKFNQIDINQINEIYIDLIEKMLNHYPKYMSIAKSLSDKTEKYNELSIQEKCIVLEQLLKVMSPGPENGKLEMIGLTNRVGRLHVQNLDLDKIVFYYQSVTGIYTKKEKL